jgi:transcriptional regulator with XRE-family HTH domain
MLERRVLTVEEALRSLELARAAVDYRSGPTLGERLRTRRTQLRLSQSEVADELGVHQGTIAKWERGDPPGRNRTRGLARFLKVPTEVVEQLAIDAERAAEKVRGST